VRWRRFAPPEGNERNQHQNQNGVVFCRDGNTQAERGCDEPGITPRTFRRLNRQNQDTRTRQHRKNQPGINRILNLQETGREDGFAPERRRPRKTGPSRKKPANGQDTPNTYEMRANKNVSIKTGRHADEPKVSLAIAIGSKYTAKIDMLAGSRLVEPCPVRRQDSLIDAIVHQVR